MFLLTYVKWRMEFYTWREIHDDNNDGDNLEIDFFKLGLDRRNKLGAF